ncbi:hypothetical protein HanIR_Chr06g0271811 [Helianthus annuus]|nr:hypothetical protein HanIR_Chr06g0271811 [Helianthus annuus]
MLRSTAKYPDLDPSGAVVGAFPATSSSGSQPDSATAPYDTWSLTTNGSLKSLLYVTTAKIALKKESVVVGYSVAL